jgi:tRNA G46 methylase TrmB
MYDSILKPGGLLKLKTDDDGLFEYSIEQLAEYRDFGSSPE